MNRAKDELSTLVKHTVSSLKGVSEEEKKSALERIKAKEKQEARQRP